MFYQSPSYDSKPGMERTFKNKNKYKVIFQINDEKNISTSY